MKYDRMGKFMKYKELIKKNYNLLFYVIPSMIGIAVFLIIPLMDVFKRSFMNGMATEFTGIDNYKTVLQNHAFQLAVKNTLLFDIISLPLLLWFSLVMAYVVSKMKSKLIRFAFLVPLAVPSNAVVTVWRMLFDDAGIVNGIRDIMGFAPVSFLTGKNSLFLLVGTYLWKNMGYNMLIWFSALAVIPENVYEAAKLDGAGSLRIFFRMTLPNVRGAFYTISVLSFVNSFKVYRETYLLAGNYPDNNIYMLQHLFNNWFGKLDISKLSAAAVLTAIFLFAVLGILRLIILPKDKKRRKRHRRNETY